MYQQATRTKSASIIQAPDVAHPQEHNLYIFTVTPTYTHAPHVHYTYKLRGTNTSKKYTQEINFDLLTQYKYPTSQAVHHHLLVHVHVGGFAET